MSNRQTCSEAIGAKIRDLRRASGMTLDELGERAGLKKSAVAKYEKGLLGPDLEGGYCRFAEALGVTTADLLGALLPLLQAGDVDRGQSDEM